MSSGFLLRKRRAACPREKALFARFYASVTAHIPTGAQDVVKERHPSLKIARIQNVRTERTYDLALLVLIVQETLPDFAIPSDVLAFVNAQEGGAE